MARSRRPSVKGCCAMCASGKGKVRGQGWASRAPARDHRRTGRARRTTRNTIPPDQIPDRR